MTLDLVQVFCFSRSPLILKQGEIGALFITARWEWKSGSPFCLLTLVGGVVLCSSWAGVGIVVLY